MLDLIHKGYLMEKISEDGKLVLYNYTDKCQFEKMWNEITLNSRGHVYEISTGSLIALPFPKFFNLTELPTEQQKELLERTDYTITEKIDGSLGIIFWYEGRWRINTRGSFNSDQSNEALKILQENYTFKCTNYNLTFLVEIVYPENQIVINYGNKRKLVLLSIYDKISKKELSRELISQYAELFSFPLVKEYLLTFDEMFEFQKNEELTIEGFVVRYSNGLRIKIKSKRYLDIARVLANLSPLSLWKTMKHGKVELDLEIIPEEFSQEIIQLIKELEMNYQDLKNEIYHEFNNLTITSRKEIGLNKELKHKSCIFSLLDKKEENIDIYIMKRIRPRSDIDSSR